MNGVAIFGGAVGADELLDVDTDCTQKVDCGEWTSFDMCSGHTSGLGVYHYHFPPTCLLTQAETDNPSTGVVEGHSPQIGWSFDGFPVYGPLYVDGVSASTLVDDCGGIEENLPKLDKFKYRYYLTGNTSDLYSLPSYPMPEESDYPYTIKCYVGCTYDELEDGSCTGTNGYFSGGTNKYTPTALSGYTDSFADYATDTDDLVNYLGDTYTSDFITSDGTCEDTS